MRCPAKQLLFLAVILVAAQANAAALFDEERVLNIELTGPISTLIADKQGRTELPFVIRANGLEHNVKVRIRGRSRTRVCDFPPLRIAFSDDDSRETVFAGQTTLKLVTECRNRKQARADILQEFAAYRIFNLISDMSYKVRLLHVTYIDNDGRLNDKLREQNGFLIESDTELSNRLGAVPAQLEGVSRRSLDTEQAAAVYVYQYLIGNTDWSLVTADEDDKCCHNGDLFKTESTLYLIPYDFDLSGLVNATYARPDSSIGISRVTQRRYRGYCVSQEALLAAVRRIKAQRVNILNTLREIPGLAQKYVDENVKFLEKFFAEAEDEAKLVHSFDKRCL